MTTEGLHQVENPSMMLLSGRPSNVSGTCVACVIEGSRPILAEVQALVSKTSFGTPRRMSTGFDYNRTALLIAVLEKRAGYFFGNLDTYINIVGGLRLDEPAADLPVSLALISVYWINRSTTMLSLLAKLAWQEKSVQSLMRKRE